MFVTGITILAATIFGFGGFLKTVIVLAVWILTVLIPWSITGGEWFRDLGSPLS